MKLLSQIIVSVCIYYHQYNGSSVVRAITRHAHRDVQSYDRPKYYYHEQESDEEENRPIVEPMTDVSTGAFVGSRYYGVYADNSIGRLQSKVLPFLRNQESRRKTRQYYYYYNNNVNDKNNNNNNNYYYYNRYRSSTYRKLNFSSNVARTDDSCFSSMDDDKNERKRIPMNVLGFFQYESSDGYSGNNEARSDSLEAVKMAVEDMNRIKLLGCDYYLNLQHYDTKGDAGIALYAFLEAIHNDGENRIKVIISASNARVTRALSKIVHAWHIPLISSGYPVSQLNVNNRDSTFFQTVAPESSHNWALISFLNHFKWSSVVSLCEKSEPYIWNMNDLAIKLEEVNITREESIYFSKTDLANSLKAVQKQDSKIIVGFFSEETAKEIFCRVHDMKLYGGDYVWIVATKFTKNWWKDGKFCLVKNLLKAVNGLLLIDEHIGLKDSDRILFGKREDEFSKLLPTSVSIRSKETYDATWTVGLSIRRALKSIPACPPSTHNRDQRLYCYSGLQFQTNILRSMQSIRFQGTSGPVMFNGSDRLIVTTFKQIQEGEKVTVAVYQPFTNNNNNNNNNDNQLSFGCDSCYPLFWPNGYIPVVKRTYELHILTIESFAFYVITLLACVGIIICAVLLAFNFHFRQHRYIKLSSPCLNTTMIAGCMLIYTAVIFLGIDDATLPSILTFNSVCTARVMFMSTGFSLAFGSIFAKTYRVYQIFIKSNHGIVRNKILQDSRLVPLVGIIILIDGFIITFWSKVDPMERHLHNLTVVTSLTHPTIVYQMQVEVCKSNNKTGWFLALYIYKGLLFVVGLYMTWETRNVNIPSLNDSKYVCLSVYCVVVTSPFLFVLTDISEHSNQVTLTYLTRSLLILLITSTCVLLLFAPKVYAIVKRKNGIEDHIMESLGLKFECNTIRFVKDDEHELYYRAEVQNQAYRKDIMTLDKEISKLHKELYFPSALFPQTRRTTSAKIYDKLPRFRKYSREKSSSLSEGIPMLLLSVLPVVIPRASWPCADPNDPHVIQEEVEFSSDTKLLQQQQQQRDEEESDEPSRHHLRIDDNMKASVSDSALQNSSVVNGCPRKKKYVRRKIGNMVIGDHDINADDNENSEDDDEDNHENSKYDDNGKEDGDNEIVDVNHRNVTVCRVMIHSTPVPENELQQHEEPVADIKISICEPPE